MYTTQTTENTRVINNSIYLFSAILKCNSNKSSENKFVMSKKYEFTQNLFSQ